MLSNGTYLAIIYYKSKNVLYYLKNCFRNNRISTGKTNDFRIRMNKHISSRLGTSRDKSYNDVFKCSAENNYTLESYFKIMEIAEERLLLIYESYLHKKGYGSMN